jgi:hypothetical protein
MDPAVRGFLGCCAVIFVILVVIALTMLFGGRGK